MDDNSLRHDLKKIMELFEPSQALAGDHVSQMLQEAEERTGDFRLALTATVSTLAWELSKMVATINMTGDGRTKINDSDRESAADICAKIAMACVGKPEFEESRKKSEQIMRDVKAEMARPKYQCIFCQSEREGEIFGGDRKLKQDDRFVCSGCGNISLFDEINGKLTLRAPTDAELKAILKKNPELPELLKAIRMRKPYKVVSVRGKKKSSSFSQAVEAMSALIDKDPDLAKALAMKEMGHIGMGIVQELTGLETAETNDERKHVVGDIMSKLSKSLCILSRMFIGERINEPNGAETAAKELKQLDRALMEAVCNFYGKDFDTLRREYDDEQGNR